MGRESSERSVSRATQHSPAIRMTSTWKRFRKVWFALILLLSVIPPGKTATVSTPATSAQCKRPEDPVRQENIIKGSKIMKMDSTHNKTWTLNDSKPAGYFRLEKGTTSDYLVAEKELDYDQMGKNAEGMYVLLGCLDGTSTTPVTYRIYIILTQVNEFPPQFTQKIYSKNISENAVINDVVFNASYVVSDKDYGDTLTYSTGPSKGKADGIALGKFKMTDPKTGVIRVDGPLDHEQQDRYEIMIVVTDTGGNISSAILIVNVLDEDERGPEFQPNPCRTNSYPCPIPVIYHARLKAADKGKVSISPNPVRAIDNEAEHYKVGYSFTEGGSLPNIEKYFKIDPLTGNITKEDMELPKNVTASVTLFIKAQEKSTLKHSSVAVLIIDVLDRNSTVIISTKSSDSVSVGATFTLLGVLLSAIFVLSVFALAYWIRKKKPSHQPLPGSSHYFTRSHTKVFPIRDKRTSESYTGSSTIMTTILRGDSDETTASDRPNSDESVGRNISSNDSVKYCFRQVPDPLDNRQRPAPKSLRSLAQPIRSERSPERKAERGHLDMSNFTRRSAKSEEIFIDRKSQTGSNFGTFRSSFSTASRGLGRVANGTLETYVSEYPTLGCESQNYSTSQKSSKRRDTEKSSLIRGNKDRSLPGSPLPFRVEHYKRGRENVDLERSHSAPLQRDDPNMPTDIAPPIPFNTDISKRPTPNKPPRKFSNEKTKQLSRSFNEKTRAQSPRTIDRSGRGEESSIPVQGRQTKTISDLAERARRSPVNSSRISKRSTRAVGHTRSSLPRSSSNRTRLTEKQISERAYRSLEKKLNSLEKSRALNARRNQTPQQSPKKSEKVRRRVASPSQLPLHNLQNDRIVDSSSSLEEQTDTRHFRVGDSSAKKRRTPPPLPKRKSNTKSDAKNRLIEVVPSSEEEDPKYVNVKYLSLIGDSATDLSNRLAEFSSSSVSRNHSQNDDESVYMEPASIQHCLEADLNIRAKLELILASALQKKKEIERKNTDKGHPKEENTKEETKLRHNSLVTDILPMPKFVNTNTSSSSSSYSERDDFSSSSCLKSQSLENIFLGSADVVWPDPETAIAALRQHHLAMEDYTASLAREKRDRTSPCNSITSISSNASRCHFGRVNSFGQFIVDIPCAESNIRVAKATTPTAIPFREVETSMEAGLNSPTTPELQNEAPKSKSCDGNSKENCFPQTISFDGIDQYEIVHRHTVPRPTSNAQNSPGKILAKTEKTNQSDRKQTLPRSNKEDVTNSNRIIDSLINILSIESHADENGHVSSKTADKSARSQGPLPISRNGTSGSLSQGANASFHSDCATVMSSELYEPTDSDCETVRSLKLFDSIFDNEESVTFSSAESDSQSVFRACHPMPQVQSDQLTAACDQIPSTKSRLHTLACSPIRTTPNLQSPLSCATLPETASRRFMACDQIPTEPQRLHSSVCPTLHQDQQSSIRSPTSTGCQPSISYPSGSYRVENEIEGDGDDGIEEAEDGDDDIMTRTGNGRTGSYSVSVGLPNGVDAVYKEPILNAYKTVSEDSNALKELDPRTTKFQRTFGKKKKSKRVGRKNRNNRLKVSDVY